MSMQITDTVERMTEAEARACVDQIKSDLETVRERLFELREREGWKVLGYPSFRECITAEFAMSESQAHRLCNAHMVDRILTQPWRSTDLFRGDLATSGDTPIGVSRPVATIENVPAAPASQLPETHTRELAPLIHKPEALRAVYREAQKRTNGFPTAAAIREVAAEISAPESPFHPDHPSNAQPDVAPFVMPEREEETEEERAYFTLSRQRLLARYAPGAVAATAADPSAALPAWEEFERWFREFMIVLRARASRPIRLAE